MLDVLPLLLIACKDPAPEDVPPGLEPLEENAAALPDDETVNFVSSDDEDYHNTNARGRVNAPLADVVACVQDPEVGVDRRRVFVFTVTDGVNPEYTTSYDVITEVHDTIDLIYTLEWLQGDLGDGTYGVRWTKLEDQETDANAFFLNSLVGSVFLQPIDDTSTDVGIIEHLEATSTSTDDTEQFTGDFYASILACSHGEALPTYE